MIPVLHLFLQNSVPVQRSPHPLRPPGTGVPRGPLQGRAMRRPARRSLTPRCRAVLLTWRARTDDFAAPRRKGTNRDGRRLVQQAQQTKTSVGIRDQIHVEYY